MDKRERKAIVLLMMHEIVEMSSEEFIYFCIKLRASRPDELNDQVEYLAQAFIEIRKRRCKKNVTNALFKGRIYHPKIKLNNKKPHKSEEL